MKVKRFVGSNIQEAILKVKTEMGKEAIILHTRKFKEGGIMGFFAHELVEVTAAIDDNPIIESKPEPKKEVVNPLLIQAVPNKNNAISANILESNKQVAAAEKSDSIEISDDMQDMKTMIRQIMEDMNQYKQGKPYPKLAQKAYHQLIKHEVDDKIAAKLIHNLIQKAAPSDLKDNNAVLYYLEEGIKQILRIPQPINTLEDGKQQIVGLVGSTGVGKTTTIAKLAANFSLLQKKKIALITIDTYRIAAVEQLKTYAQIIGIPIEVVFTADTLREALAKHRDKDLIFIDTAGRSPKNTAQMAELKSFFEVSCPTDVYLVLSASTRFQDMADAYNRFNVVPITKLLFTKLDETNTFGPIINMVNRSKKKLSYITTGQSVPDDIEVADPQRIARLILGGMSR